MKLYSISYSLRPDVAIPVCSAALRRIKDAGEWHHPIETVWFVATDKTSSELFDATFDPDCYEGFFVTEVEPMTIKGWGSKLFWNWISQIKEKVNN